MPGRNKDKDKDGDDSPGSKQAAPTPSAPGERAQRLQTIFDSALKHTLKPCTYDNFSACFPTPARWEPDALREFHDTFVARLDEQCRIEFRTLLAERAVVPSLNKLDALLKDAERRRATADSSSEPVAPAQAPPHLLPPETVLNAHLHPFMAAQDTALQSRLTQVQDSNAALAAQIAAQRTEMNALLANLEAVVADVEGAAAALRDAGEMQGLDADLDAHARMLSNTG